MLVTSESESDSLKHVAEIVFLSPHLDDAVLGAGALIARQVAEGKKVAVWTVFTGTPPGARPRARFRVFCSYDERFQEDERALSLLGAGYRWLGFGERIWSEPPVSNSMQLFRTPKSAASFENLAAIAETIEKLLDHQGVTIYAPLGVGNHYDHVEVALAALKVLCARRAFSRLLFYEDFYATDAAARRRHFVTRRLTWGPFKASGWASPAVGLLLRFGAWSARGPGIDTYLPEVACLSWSCKVEPVGEFEVAKLDAVAEYRSQVSAIGGFGKLKSYLRRAHALHGGELIWRADVDEAAGSKEKQPPSNEK
ncbi:MAG: PIG-L family deacetylase [Deltaproteobacteria bacterium]|nr:PIG-L family deacetylase [Deltaproteobacteria bacterium]